MMDAKISLFSKMCAHQFFLQVAVLSYSSSLSVFLTELYNSAF